jgi:hypothetical protein
LDISFYLILIIEFDRGMNFNFSHLSHRFI